MKQLLELHKIDQAIKGTERELRRLRDQLASTEEGVAGLAEGLEKLEQELERVRVEARQTERAADEKRDHLYRLRSKVNQVRTEKQYGAATLEFDLVKQELRKLEDRALDKLQVVEDLEGRKKETAAQLEGARSVAGPQREEIVARSGELEDEIAILKDRRANLAIRLDSSMLALYERIRAGRSEVVLAPLTEESACGNCYTSVTVQQELQIRGMSTVVCCEGCGVILHPRDLKD